MERHKLAQESYQLIRKDLGLEEELDLKTAENPFDRLSEFLTRRIRHLLDHDLGRLLNAMYRIDIPEYRVKEILELSEPGEIASNLAEAVIRREKEKVETRIKYSS